MSPEFLKNRTSLFQVLTAPLIARPDLPVGVEIIVLDVRLAIVGRNHFSHKIRIKLNVKQKKKEGSVRLKSGGCLIPSLFWGIERLRVAACNVDPGRAVDPFKAGAR